MTEHGEQRPDDKEEKVVRKETQEASDKAERAERTVDKAYGQESEKGKEPAPKASKESKAEEMTTLTCSDCGAEVSGPDKESVADAMDRHKRSTGHDVRTKPAQPRRS